MVFAKSNGETSPDSERREQAFQALSTPLIDITNLAVDKNGNGGIIDANINNDDEPKGQQQQDESTLLFAPLHRDGEQARLVEEVRRRQRRQQEEMTFTQWFWDILGLVEDTRRSNNNFMPPPNPYRDDNGRRSTLDKNKPKHEQNGNKPPLIDSKPNTAPTPSIDISKYPRIVRFIYYSLQRILYALRWCTDFCIMRLARLEPFTNSPNYSSSPAYVLHITADNIICALVISWATTGVAGPMTLVVCLFIALVYVKGMRRVYPEDQQQNANETTACTSKDASVSATTLQPKQLSANDQHAIAMQRIQKKHPNATHAECTRFYKCVKFKEEAALSRLEDFFQWRTDCGLRNVAEKDISSSEVLQQLTGQAFIKKDEEDWNAAAKMAISIITKDHESSVNLPQIICSYEEHSQQYNGTNDTSNQNDDSELPLPPRCRDGTRILHILPFRLDLSIATAPTYSLAAALYLDRRLERTTTERITLFCDVRGGRGWANPTPWSTLPFIQSTASLLGSHYPERLERLVLVPMPRSAIWVWSAAQKCLDPDTASKVVVVGASDGTSGLPEKMKEFVHEDALAVLEKRRRSFFVG